MENIEIENSSQDILDNENETAYFDGKLVLSRNDQDCIAKAHRNVKRTTNAAIFALAFLGGLIFLLCYCNYHVKHEPNYLSKQKLKLAYIILFWVFLGLFALSKGFELAYGILAGMQLCKINESIVKKEYRPYAIMSIIFSIFPSVGTFFNFWFMSKRIDNDDYLVRN